MDSNCQAMFVDLEMIGELEYEPVRVCPGSSAAMTSNVQVHGTNLKSLARVNESSKALLVSMFDVSDYHIRGPLGNAP